MIFKHRFDWRKVFLFLLFPFFCLSCATTKHVSEYYCSYTVINRSIKADSAVAMMLSPYRESMDSLMNITIGYTSIPLSKAQPESTLGNFMADAIRYRAIQMNTSVQASIINYGGIRLSYLQPGAITRGQIFELMPFDSKLAIMEIPGKILQEFCDHMAQYGGWPLSGMTYQIKNKKAINLRIGELPVNPQMIYIIATLDYVANGGDNCTFLKNCRRTYYNPYIRDIIIENIIQKNKYHDSLAPTLENRISYVE